MLSNFYRGGLRYFIEGINFENAHSVVVTTIPLGNNNQSVSKDFHISQVLYLSFKTAIT